SERTRGGALLGVPAHLYRQALGDVVGWARAMASGESGRAFHHEVRLRFFHGFFRTRRREFFGAPRQERRGTRSALKLRHVISPLVRGTRAVDHRLRRLTQPGVRDVVFDARTAMEYGMMAPLHRRLLADPRLRSW